MKSLNLNIVLAGTLAVTASSMASAAALAQLQAAADQPVSYAGARAGFAEASPMNLEAVPGANLAVADGITNAGLKSSVSAPTSKAATKEYNKDAGNSLASNGALLGAGVGAAVGLGYTLYAADAITLTSVATAIGIGAATAALGGLVFGLIAATAYALVVGA